MCLHHLACSVLYTRSKAAVKLAFLSFAIRASVVAQSLVVRTNTSNGSTSLCQPFCTASYGTLCLLTSALQGRCLRCLLSSDWFLSARSLAYCLNSRVFQRIADLPRRVAVSGGYELVYPLLVNRCFYSTPILKCEINFQNSILDGSLPPGVIAPNACLTVPFGQGVSPVTSNLVSVPVASGYFFCYKKNPPWCLAAFLEQIFGAQFVFTRDQISTTFERDLAQPLARSSTNWQV